MLASMAGALLQGLALHMPGYELAGIERASKIWPLNHEFRRTLVEWAVLMPTEPGDAVRDLSWVLENDPWSADALAARIAYEFKLDRSTAALADWNRLTQVAPRSALVLAAKSNSERSPSPPSEIKPTGGKENDSYAH